jgi:hypothetical protein
LFKRAGTSSVTGRGWMPGDRCCGHLPTSTSSSAPDFVDQPMEPGRRDLSNSVELGSSIRAWCASIESGGRDWSRGMRCGSPADNYQRLTKHGRRKRIWAELHRRVGGCSFPELHLAPSKQSASTFQLPRWIQNEMRISVCRVSGQYCLALNIFFGFECSGEARL